MQEIHVQLLSREDSLGKGMATDSNILAWRSLWTVGYSSWGREESDMTE